jgi:murein DD-endopeptidase MepM/ murein hydrolase activator NlpD
MPVINGPGGPPQPTPAPDPVRDRPQDPGHGTPPTSRPGAVGPTPVTAQAGPTSLVEAPGTGSLPWDQPGIIAPSPEMGLRPPDAKRKLDLSGIDAARGVVSTIRQQAKMHGVPVALALAVAKQESGFRQEAVSPAGAVGIMQLMPGTAQGLSVDPYNWKQNIEGGVRYLAMQYGAFGNWKLALAAYNAGPGAVKDGSWRNISQTTNYVKDVSAIAKQIAGGSFTPMGGSTGLVQVSAPLPGNPTVVNGFGPRGQGALGISEKGPSGGPMGGGKPVSIIGTPYVGTHTDFGNWESDNAFDFALPYGTPVYALAKGRIGSQIGALGSSSPQLEGLRLHLETKGNEYYYAHLSKIVVKAGQAVQPGTLLGYSGSANGVEHLHLGMKGPDHASAAVGRRLAGIIGGWVGSSGKAGPVSEKPGGDFHAGVDLGAPIGTPVHAMVGGKVIFSGWTSGGGNTLSIRDKGGRIWNYFHMQEPSSAATGAKVKAGTKVGLVGATGQATGPHLDLHLTINGQWANPMSLINKAFGAGWGKTKTVSVSANDFLSPADGGVNGTGQAAGGGGAGGGSATQQPPSSIYVSGVQGSDAQPAQGVDAAVAPGGQQAMPANAQAWQRIVNSGPVSPETKNLAARAGAMTSDSPSLAEVYTNPGGGG